MEINDIITSVLIQATTNVKVPVSNIFTFLVAGLGGGGIVKVIDMLIKNSREKAKQLDAEKKEIANNMLDPKEDAIRFREMVFKELEELKGKEKKNEEKIDKYIKENTELKVLVGELKAQVKELIRANDELKKQINLK